jgi:hypothetical protein
VRAAAAKEVVIEVVAMVTVEIVAVEMGVVMEEAEEVLVMVLV